MQPIRQSFFAPCLLALFACACAPVSKDASVWENYDVRHATSTLPEPYIDNDSYYQAPECSMLDGPNCGGG